MGSWRPMTVILMSRSEIDRMNVLRDLAEEDRFACSDETVDPEFDRSGEPGGG
jgi:hypothetical protein